MILQSCYDETIAAINTKTDLLISRLQRGHADDCIHLALKYRERASQQDSDISNDIGSRPGWLNAELNLLFAQQKLDTLQVIQQTCK